MTNTKFVVVGIVLLIAGGFAYSYTSSLLPQVQQGRALCQTLLGQAGQLVSPQVSSQCQQAQDFGPMITAAVPISAVLAVLWFMLGVLGSFIDQKHKVAQVSWASESCAANTPRIFRRSLVLSWNIRYLELDGYPKVATMLQLEIDKIDRILPKPESKHLFRGKEISQSSRHLPNKKKVIA